jgi:UDP-2,3-diacylglucosamine pyrophosphatase LpxH
MDSMSAHKLFIVFVLFLYWSLSSANDKSFLVLSDIHLDVNSKHTMALAPKGMSLLNDTDIATYQAMIIRLRAAIDQGIIDKPDYIFVLGDLVGHFRATKEDVLQAETLTFNTLKTYFPDTPVVYTFGNNDSFVSNYGPFISSAKESPLQVAQRVWPQQEDEGGFVWAKPLCQQSSSYPCVIANNDEDGYYSAYLAYKLRIISLNTVLYSPKVSAESAYHAGQQQIFWLANQLQDANQHQESVLLLMHIPPGEQVFQGFWNWSSLAFWRDNELQAFLQLIDEYHQDIIGIFAGHTHKDELKIIRDKAHKVLAGVYVNGSLASIHGNAPSVRSYTLHEANQQWHVHDYTVYQYYEPKTAEIALRRLYSYRDYYCTRVVQSINECLPEVTPEKMQRYYTADNKHFLEQFKHPEHIQIDRLS